VLGEHGVSRGLTMMQIMANFREFHFILQPILAVLGYLSWLGPPLPAASPFQRVTTQYFRLLAHQYRCHWSKITLSISAFLISNLPEIDRVIFLWIIIPSLRMQFLRCEHLHQESTFALSQYFYTKYDVIFLSHRHRYMNNLITIDEHNYY